MIFAAGLIIGFCAGAITVTMWALCQANKEEEDNE